MIFNEWTLVYLLILHFVSDALLQSREMALQKSENFWWLSYHCGIIFMVFWLGVWIIGPTSEQAVLFSGLNAFTHFIIDGIIWRVYKKSVIIRHPNATKDYKYYEDKSFYTTILLDQMLHITTIIILLGVLR